MRYSDIPRVLTMTIVWMLLLVWNLGAYRSDCLPTLLLLALFTLVLWISGSEYALAKRRAFVDAFLVPDGALFGWYRFKLLLITLEGVKALLLAAFLLISALTFAPRQWSMLFADVLFIGLLLPRLYAGLAGQIRDRYRYATARRWALWASVLFLWVESLVVLLFFAGEDFIGLRWQEVVAYGASGVRAECHFVAQGTGIVSAIEALGRWSVQNLQRNLSDLPQALMAAIGLTTAVALLFLRAYVFSRALLGVVGRPWNLWHQAPQEPQADVQPDSKAPGSR